MKFSKLDIFMTGVTAVTAVVFCVSVYLTGVDNVRASRKVASISEITVPEVPAVSTNRPTGVVSAEEWSSYYPDIYASHMRNAENTGHDTGRVAYTEADPYIQTLYQGMAFSFDYTEAVGHSYTLDDITETTRPHKLANCLTCKTPDLTALVNELGPEVYSTDFNEIFAQVSEPISCYTCHANTPGTVVISSDYMAAAMNDDIEAHRVDAVNVACAQCHIEYYFDSENKATSVPYTGMDNIDPDSILAYYNEMGFVDFTNENTGVGMIKVQHPEFETYTGAGSQHAGMYNCADCHMGVAYDKDGYPYVNHMFTSPLDNEALLKETCFMCHKDLKTQVAEIQAEITGREAEIGQLLVELNSKLADAVKAGTLSEDELNEIRSLDRNAQFYWDFVYVENSEGAHNSALSRECLDKAEAIANEALSKLI
ncbi:MAG: ammonia-forming cytochrome c nitrite reductase subunit c552 [Eubacteriales bacterium]|nr:ammonia-forming cytochrome c nitrite reductase subunit c552 [Eubacteriales bacterium]